MADHAHTERRPGAAAAAAAHGTAHGVAAHGAAHADAHAGHAHAGHGAHHDPAVDKRAAFVGLIAGMAVIGALMYGMVQWTNAQFAGHAGGERAAGASTH